MKHGCNHKVLHSTNIGKVSLCASCGNLRIEIGHLMSLISPEPFQLILADFKARKQFYSENRAEEESEDPVIICLNNNNLFLKLTPAEFDEVVELFEVSHHMLEVKQLMGTV